MIPGTAVLLYSRSFVRSKRPVVRFDRYVTDTLRRRNARRLVV